MKKLFLVSTLFILLLSCVSNSVNIELSTEYYNIANGFLTQGKYKEAIDYYLRSLELNPNNQSPLYNLGLAYVELGDFEKAISVLEKIAYKDDANTQIIELKAYCYYKMEDFKKSLTLYMNLDDIRKTDMNIKINILILYSLLNKPADVIVYGEKILIDYYELLPLKDVYRYLGDAALAMSDDVKAESYYSSFYNNSGSDKEVINSLKDIYRRLNNSEKEKEFLLILSGMSDVDSKDAIYFRLGFLELLGNNFEQAYVFIDKAVTLGYDNQDEFNQLLDNPDLIVSDEIRALLVSD